MSNFDLSRRGLASLATGLFGATLSLPEARARTAAGAVQTQPSTVLQTPLGGLIGTAIESGGAAVTAYKGIPYAVPPVGARRWRPAEAAPPWNCRRDATGFGPQAVQVTEPDAMFYALPQAVQSEDCLYLNVWTPADRSSAQKFPVMVWIHGGAFMTGAGSLPVYDGAALARKGVVVVTINYRLGVLGYFAHPELISEAQGGICANFGTTDQIAALRWVKDNIAAFGGDPGNVTIFGQSAGAMSVSMLMATPLSKGLFHRAIGQSGGFFFPMRTLGRPSWGSPPAEELGAAFAKRLGAASLAELRALPVQMLAAAAPQNGDLLNELGALMVVDGQVFEKSVLDTFRAGAQHAVPVLVGFNSDEASGIADYGAIPVLSDSDAYAKDMHRRYGALADAFLARYPAHDPQGAAFDAFRDGGFGWPVLEWAALQARIQRSTYLYFFSHTPPGADVERSVFGSENRRRIGAFHAAEIAYVFNNVDRKVLSVWCDDGPHANRPAGSPRPEDIRLADVMSDYWVSFAKTGAPTSDAAKWVQYDDAGSHYMHFDGGAHPSQHLMPGMRDFSNQVERARKSAGTYWYLGGVGARGQATKANL